MSYLIERGDCECERKIALKLRALGDVLESDREKQLRHWKKVKRHVRDIVIGLGLLVLGHVLWKRK